MDRKARRYESLLKAKKAAKSKEFKKLWQDKLYELLLKDNKREGILH
tara:strand:+ start:3694 stop:3834 length:141 start_codon:yes stop_codon:yes gene_type:complete